MREESRCGGSCKSNISGRNPSIANEVGLMRRLEGYGPPVDQVYCRNHEATGSSVLHGPDTVNVYQGVAKSLGIIP